MMYVDVILPLPLEGLFTYAVPDTMQSLVRQGVRVQVPLGKSKTYTAMVARCISVSHSLKRVLLCRCLMPNPSCCHSNLSCGNGFLIIICRPLAMCLRRHCPQD